MNMIKSGNDIDKKDNKNLAFIKEIAKYFMEFLETDFHRRRNPKRNIKLQSEDNLLIGLNLKKYPSFNKLIWKSINHAFDKTIVDNIKKDVYKAEIPKNLLDLINNQIDKISEKQVNDIIKSSAIALENASIVNKDDYNKIISQSLDEISSIIRNGLVLKFVETLERPLSNLNLGDENTIYLIEEEITDILVKTVKDKVIETLRFMFNKEKVSVSKNLKSCFKLETVKNSLTEFFESYRVADLFNEFYEIDKNKNILDKKEFYLYFCDISFNRVKYPIFYIPFNISKEGNSFLIDFDAQVYINKKALEYIVQEYNKNTGKKSNLKSISERIIYLAHHKSDLTKVLQEIIDEIVNFFEMDNEIKINSDEVQSAKSILVRASNSCYVNLFDKSDEALINDYEEIMQLLIAGDNVLSDAFNRLIDNFINKEPKMFGEEVYEEWDDLTPGDKLAFKAPIPLNSEQRQILSALNKNDCNYVTVQGPPGTGKSHTITAIVFDAILSKKSILVLSDKKEALDVVEDKISETMDKVRHDKDFQNPILRLGKTGNTYSKILSNTSIENIKTNYRAVKKEFSSIKDNIDKVSNTLKEDIEAEILAYSEIDINEIYEIINLEQLFDENKIIGFDVDEILQQNGSAIDLEEVRMSFLRLKNKFEDNNLNQFLEDNFNIEFEQIDQTVELDKLVLDFKNLLRNYEDVKVNFNEALQNIETLNSFSDDSLIFLEEYIREYEDIKNWLFGYLLKKKKIDELNNKFKTNFYSSKLDSPHKHILELKGLLDLFTFINKFKKNNKTEIKYDYLSMFYKVLSDKDFVSDISDVVEMNNDIEYLRGNSVKYNKTFAKIGFNSQSLKSYYNNKLVEIDELTFYKFIRFISLKQKVSAEFQNVPIIDYIVQKKNIESLVTTQMTYIMDESLVKFYEENQATAKTLRSIIRNKERFPKKDFIKLKEAFPCILAGIRDYAEYIPLEPEMFDLLIIDEASQVSIAQAFPALLRAKKVLILGDKKQFSNVKAAHARSDTNREFLNNIEDVFKKNISNESDKLTKLKKFDIKTSILEFFEFINNYNIQLVKYFRGYKEIISYSNKYFYQGLQTMKIRGKNINEVLKFDVIESDGKQEIIPNTNNLEIDFIIKELKKIKSNDKNSSVGIITPHTNQQKLIMEKIRKLPESDYFFDKLKLKIMTFDTCQGEERDIIFYSMVATKEQDHLWGVFIKNLKDVDLEEDGKIKAQRLNVGFSRAKECMHFVLSKPVEEYNGSIGEALMHYKNTLEDAKKEKEVTLVDKKSKMEPEVLHWFYQTKFWINNKDTIEFIPQFKIGDYLKQLDKFYEHPKYIVDFLLIFKDENHVEHKIIIEYDGFREHFKNIDEVNEFNYNHYYSDEDVLRQKTLESYGYKFIRINKFNSGNKPIETLDNRISALIKNNFNQNKFSTNIQKTIQSLQNGDMKECPKCKKVQLLNDFKDNGLITGYGRFCNKCKNISPVIVVNNRNEETAVNGIKICSACGSNMFLRNGRYGEFYGCSKYPYCKGTRKV